VLLPPTSDALNGSILTTDGSFQWQNLTARRYTFADANHSYDQWVTTPNLVAEIRDGPAVLLPATSASAEQAWYTGSFGHTDYYNVSGDSWSQGPDFPNSRVAWDTPAAVLPTGQVLIVSGPPPYYSNGQLVDNYPAPYTISEFSPSSSTPFTDVYTGPTAGLHTLQEIHPYECHMLVLPTGQILISTGSTTNNTHPLLVYTHHPDSTDLNLTSLQPGINSGSNSIATVGTNQFTLSGYRLNGVTEGAYYGDNASNYPLIRFRGVSNGNIVSYGITSGWSNTGIESPGDTTPMTTNFSMSSSFYQNTGGVYNGWYYVELVVNGIVNTATPWSLYKQGTSNTWMPGGPPIGGGAAPPDGRSALLRMVNPATVMAADNTVTVAAPSSGGKELPLPQSATGGETSRQPLAWDIAVARTLANRVNWPSPEGIEWAFRDVGEGDVKGI
jgi:hypothetical protein